MKRERIVRADIKQMGLHSGFDKRKSGFCRLRVKHLKINFGPGQIPKFLSVQTCSWLVMRKYCHWRCLAVASSLGSFRLPLAQRHLKRCLCTVNCSNEAVAVKFNGLRTRMKTLSVMLLVQTMHAFFRWNTKISQTIFLLSPQINIWRKQFSNPWHVLRYT
jgi:hypothetical protein